MDVLEHSILGRGVFGVVYKDHLPVAVKKIRNYGLNAVKEVEVLKELSHVNIIRYYSHHFRKILFFGTPCTGSQGIKG